MATKPRQIVRNAEPPGPSGAPLRIDAPGAPVQLSGRPYHLARLTAEGVRDLQTFMASGWLALEGDSLGDELVEGAAISGQWGRVRELLDRIIFEPLPPGIEMACEPAEIALTVTTFFDQSGMRRLGQLLKNSAARTTQAYEHGIARAGEGIAERMRTEMDTLMRAYLAALDGTEKPSPSLT